MCKNIRLNILRTKGGTSCRPGVIMLNMSCNDKKKGEEPGNNLNPWSRKRRPPLPSHGAVDSPPPHGSEAEEVVEAEDQLAYNCTQSAGGCSLYSSSIAGAATAR
jgi:hypothetical protein